MEDLELRIAGDEDIDAINAFYNRIYGKQRTRRQFIWEFNSAPAGKAIYIIAELNGTIAGTQCAIPYFIVDSSGNKTLSAKSEDTLVDPALRGKNIFEKMYFILFMECRKAGISFIWGFTYAKKPFSKLGFDIPYASSMGIVVQDPIRSYTYYSTRAQENNLSRKFKIFGLCVMSAFKKAIQRSGSSLTGCSETEFALNTGTFNYLPQKGYFGLLLDEEFLQYRMHRNAYSGNYHQLSITANGSIKAALYYTVNDGLCYLLHIYFENENYGTELIRKFYSLERVKKCFSIRFWAFMHNEAAEKEKSLLTSCGFTFVDRGISFVGLSLDGKKRDWKDFFLSRLASQGTD